MDGPDGQFVRLFIYTLPAMSEPSTERFLGFLEKAIKERLELIPQVAKTFEGVAGAVAWQVAVVSPGFLGLLWNARDLASHSRLPPPLFAAGFIGAEAAFLIGIIGSVLIHQWASEVALKLTPFTVRLRELATALDQINEPSGMSAQAVQKLRVAVEAHDDDSKAFPRKTPRWIIGLGKIHGVSALVGYVLVGVLIASMRLF